MWPAGQSLGRTLWATLTRANHAGQSDPSGSLWLSAHRPHRGPRSVARKRLEGHVLSWGPGSGLGSKGTQHTSVWPDRRGCERSRDKAAEAQGSPLPTLGHGLLQQELGAAGGEGPYYWPGLTGSCGRRSRWPQPPPSTATGEGPCAEPTYTDLGGDVLQEAVVQQLCVVLFDQRDARPALGQALAGDDVELVGACDVAEHVLDAYGDHLQGRDGVAPVGTAAFRGSRGAGGGGRGRGAGVCGGAEAAPPGCRGHRAR